jgi:hypothetical protein
MTTPKATPEMCEIEQLRAAIMRPQFGRTGPGSRKAEILVAGLAALSRLPQLEERIKELEAVLREVEWGATCQCGCGNRACPMCNGSPEDGHPPHGHDPSCRLAAALAGKETP